MHISFLIWQESCCTDLNFFKQIKDMQTPVEFNTYKQVKAILKFGEYHISCKYHQIFHSGEEIVTLRIKDCSCSKPFYTLNDLKNLESKIILIRDSRFSTVNSRGLETQSPEGMQKAEHNTLYEKSSTEVDEFLEVCTYVHKL